MRPRVLINLGVFAVVAVVMVAWLLLTLLPINFGAGPTRVEARFASSPGLHAGQEIDYLGVRIGHVGGIRLRPGYVNVTLLLNAGVPSNSTVQVLRKSAVGEPYVELSPQNAASRPFTNGDVIPLARTRSTVDYQNLFRSAGKMLQSADPADLRTLTHQLAIGLNGQGQNLHDILADLDDVTQTLADRPDVLDGLAVQLTTLAGTLSDKRTELASGINNLAAFTATLSDSRRSLDKLLTDAPSFLQQTDSLLQTAKPGLKCLFTAFGVPAPSVFNSANAQATLKTLDNVYAGFPKVIADVVDHRPEGDYIRLSALISVAGPAPARQYAKPTPDAKIPPLYYCADASTNGPSPGASPGATSTGKSGPANAMGTKAGDLFHTVKPQAARKAASKDMADRWLPRLPWLVAGAVLLATAVHTTRRVHAQARQRRRT